MEVILKEDLPGLGFVGDRVKVKRGYARNFLFPRGIALEASSKNARMLEHRLREINAKKARLKAAAEELAAKLSQAELNFTLKIGEKGKSFGSISARDIHQGLLDQGFELDRHQIKLPEPIKSGGEFEATVHLHSEVQVPLTIKVAVDDITSKKADSGQKGKKAKNERGGSSAEQTAAEGAVVEEQSNEVES
ncbi:MAG: 50S ribosomal protein L9 [Candidatus Dadabacteria bacterium]|nr:MAG: 50S ribosomal protein L9 [Candidatus Dadabacteria bacterium]